MKKKLLIVDDDIDIREMIQKYFEKENYQVTCAANGRRGLDAIKQEKQDVILLDVMRKRKRMNL